MSECGAKQKRDIMPTEEKQLIRAEGSEGLKISWRMTCADISLLRFKKSECEKDKTVVEDHPLSRSRMPAVENISARENTKTRTLFQHDAARPVLQVFRVGREEDV